MEAVLTFVNNWGGLRDLGDLPAWRKVLLLCCVAVWFSLGVRHLSKEAEIYASAPKAPVIATKQVYSVRVNHGYVRYVTKEEAAHWEFLNRTTGPVIGISALTMFFLILTFRYPRSS